MRVEVYEEKVTEIKRKRCEKRGPEDRPRKMRGNEREGEGKEKEERWKKRKRITGSFLVDFSEGEGVNFPSRRTSCNRK